MKNITLYNNYPDTTYFEQKRKELYNTYADIQCYDDESDVPCSFIKSEIDYENEVQYNNFIYQMQRLFEKTAFTLYGSIETLLGNCTNYTFIESYAQFELFIRGVKHLKIYIENDMLKIQCEHHQGTNYYSLRQLTPTGYEIKKANNPMCCALHNSEYTICPEIKKYDEEIY